MQLAGSTRQIRFGLLFLPLTFNRRFWKKRVDVQVTDKQKRRGFCFFFVKIHRFKTSARETHTKKECVFFCAPETMLFCLKIISINCLFEILFSLNNCKSQASSLFSQRVFYCSLGSWLPVFALQRKFTERLKNCIPQNMTFWSTLYSLSNVVLFCLVAD